MSRAPIRICSSAAFGRQVSRTRISIRCGHTFAARALEQGMDVVTVSRLLGHAARSITLDKYGRALDDHKRVSVEKLDGVYGASQHRHRPKER